MNHPHRSKQQQAQHTPGPWNYSFESADPNWAIVTAAGGAIVANVNSETGPDATSAPATRKMPCEANARLIAAAPETAAERDRLKALNAELLAALKSIQDSFVQDGRLLEGHKWLNSDITQAAFDNMRAIIAKAERR